MGISSDLGCLQEEPPATFFKREDGEDEPKAPNPDGRSAQAVEVPPGSPPPLAPVAAIFGRED